MIRATILSASLAIAGSAHAYCTFDYNPWGEAACEADTDGQVCDDILADALANPVPGAKAIPVYANFDETPFLWVDPNDPTNTVRAHRSLSKLDMPEADVENQIRTAIARWNQAGAGIPNFYYAGHASGDLSDAAAPDRAVGIVVQTALCSEGYPYPAGGGTAEPIWTDTDGEAYRGIVVLNPTLHGVDGVRPGTCTSLASSAPQLQVPTDGWSDQSWSPELDGALQATLVHELGHVLGLHHNFYEGANAADSCGLGDYGVQTYGVMSYSSFIDPYPRRDDVEAARALHAGNLPDAWPLLQWTGVGALPDPELYDPTGAELTTSVLPTLATSSANPVGRSALAYADASGRVRVRTITDQTLDAVAWGDDVPLDTEEGRTFAPVGVALAIRPDSTGPPDQVFAAWTVDDPLEESLQTRWAIRDLSGTVWQTYGPATLAPVTSPTDDGRYHPPIGAAYDPVQDDFVVATLSLEHRVVLTGIDDQGTVVHPPSHLRFAPAGAGPVLGPIAAPVNAIGSPVCMQTPTAGTSRCLVPIATNGAGVVGVYAFERSGAVWGTAEVFLSTVAKCPEDPGCAEHTGYGTVAVSWNEVEDRGYLSFSDDAGKVRFKELTVDPFTQDIQLTDAVVQTYGSDRAAPELLVRDPRERVENLVRGWPTCPWWNATSGGVGDGANAGSASFDHIARASCLPACGDGYVDLPPFGFERCDGDVGHTTCADLGFDDGVLACDACQWDTSGCFDYPDPDPDPPSTCTPVDFLADVGTEARHPDGDFDAAFYCPDDQGESVCVATDQAGLVSGDCASCEVATDKPPGCSCTEDTQCGPTATCWGTDVAGGDSVGRCYEVPPVWQCPETCTELFGSGAWCHNSYLQGARCFDQLTSELEAEMCHDYGEIQGVDCIPSCDGSAPCIAACGVQSGPLPAYAGTCVLECPVEASCEDWGYPADYVCGDTWGVPMCFDPELAP